jgi:hypothetical protein
MARSGAAADDTSGTSPVGYVGGLFQYVTSNITTVGGNLTETVMETFLRTAFRYGSQNKVMFVSPLVASAMSSFAQGKLALPSVDTNKYGVSLGQYQSASGAVIQIMIKRDWSNKLVHFINLVYLSRFTAVLSPHAVVYQQGLCL